MEIPTPWLWVSGVYFVMATAAQIAMIALIIKLIGVVRDVQPQIKSVSERVDNISKKVDDMSTTLKESVENFGSKSRTFADTAQLIAVEGGKRAGAISTALVAITTGIRIFKMIQEFRGARSVDKHD